MFPPSIQQQQHIGDEEEEEEEENRDCEWLSLSLAAGDRPYTNKTPRVDWTPVRSTSRWDAVLLAAEFSDWHRGI